MCSLISAIPTQYITFLVFINHAYNIYKVFIMSLLHDRSTGVVIEGFPSTPDEAEYLATKGSSITVLCGCCIADIFTGLFPDAAVILKVIDKDVISRILPNKMAIWTRKRDKRLAIREAQKQKRIKEWVGCCDNDFI